MTRLHQHKTQDPREGPSLVGRTMQGFLRDGLARQDHEEAERSRQGTSRGARDASRDDRDQAGAGLRSVLVSSLVQREQAQTKASGKGYRFGATRPRPAGRRDGGHHGAQDGVTVRVFGSRTPTLVRISVLDVPLQNGRCWRPSRSIFGKRTRVSINRASHLMDRHRTKGRTRTSRTPH